MGWLRLIGSLKLQVSFAEYRLFSRAFLQKRPVILRSLLTKAVGERVRADMDSMSECVRKQTAQSWYASYEYLCELIGLHYKRAL